MTYEQLHEAMRRSMGHGELLIHINGNPTSIGATLPTTIEHFSVWVRGSLPIQSHESAIARRWLNQVVDNFVGTHAIYNNILVPKSDLIKFKL